MAKQPTPAFRLYEGGSAPRPAIAPGADVQNISGGANSIAQSLSRAGAAVQQYQETDLRIEQLAQERRNDDARIDVARRMAEFRRETNATRLEVLNAAPEGWRGVTDTFGQRFQELQTRHLSDESLTPEARALYEDQIAVFAPSAFDAVAGDERNARGEWEVDAVRAGVNAAANDLLTHPEQFPEVLETMRETVGAQSDANARRDGMEYAQETLARFAVAGLIQQDPRAALNALRDPEDGTPYAMLSPEARAQGMDNAEGEIARRAARWRAQVSQQVAAAERMYALGLPTENDPSIETVRSALGPERALAYEAAREMSMQHGTVSRMAMPELDALIADTNPRTNERDAVIHEARRRAAVEIREELQDNPMQFQVRNGLTPPATIIEAVNQQDWGLVNGILQSRAASAQTNGERLGVRPLPLTAFEAGVLGPQIRAMTAENRGRFLRNAAAWMGRDSPAFSALNAQLFPDSPATAYAGYLTGVGGERGAQDADLIHSGVDLLGGRSSGDSEGGGSSRSRLIDMPENDDLVREWRNYVGDAYAGFGPEGARRQGLRQAEAQSYGTYVAAYAGLIARNPQSSDTVNPDLARRAAQIASGGVVVWGGGRETLMPPGMTPRQFQQSVNEGFARFQQFQGQNPRDYNLMPYGVTADGRGFRYGVLDGDDPVRSPSGRSVEIEVRRR
jgi:hypothetical protein